LESLKPVISGFVSTNPETLLSQGLKVQTLKPCVRAQKKGREFDPRPLYNLKGDTRATNAKKE
jgi:hypothetical protein